MTVDANASVRFPKSPYSEELIGHLLPFAILKQIPARKKLFLTVGNESYCYLLLTGQATMHKEDDNMVLLTLTAPTLIGPAQMLGQHLQTYIKPLTACKVGVLPLKKALEVIEEQNLWETMTKHMVVILNKLYSIHQQLSAPTAYGQIKAQLIELMNEDKSLRHNMTAERYIRDKTNLSRSGVMRILSALKEGGYVEMSRGILLKINTLPEKF